MSLHILNESVRSSLRSGVAITCLSQCVEELVHNSIDAGSSCIAVCIDIPKLMIQVKVFAYMMQKYTAASGTSWVGQVF